MLIFQLTYRAKRHGKPTTRIESFRSDRAARERMREIEQHQEPQIVQTLVADDFDMWWKPKAR